MAPNFRQVPAIKCEFSLKGIDAKTANLYPNILYLF